MKRKLRLIGGLKGNNMGRKVFVSYKYWDTEVQHLSNMGWRETTKVRDYVDILEAKIGHDNIYCGEKDGEDLDGYSEDYIWNKLRDKIFPTTVTVVLISPGMKEENRRDKSQWIPWEIRYSLREHTRSYTSHTNGIVAVVLPDKNGSYDYMIEMKSCGSCHCRVLKTEKLFWILQKNIFNKIDKEKKNCSLGDDVYTGECGYIKLVKWSDFIVNDTMMNFYIEEAADKIARKAEFDLHLDVNKE